MLTELKGINRYILLRILAELPVYSPGKKFKFYRKGTNLKKTWPQMQKNIFFIFKIKFATYQKFQLTNTCCPIITSDRIRTPTSSLLAKSSRDSMGGFIFVTVRDEITVPE